ncbi:MAG: HYR domain-containing protein [Bacteroidia bacterium]|nr:HYR domain-containing protein [Bacteroidia bacterium]
MKTRLKRLCNLSLLILVLCMWQPGYSTNIPDTDLHETRVAASISSVATGNWNDPAIWSGGLVPTSADDVTIAEGTTVTVNGYNIDFATLTVEVATVLNDPNGVLNLGLTTLNGTGTFVSNGVVNINNTITLNGDLTNNGEMSWNGGALIGNAGVRTMTNAGVFNMNTHNQSITDVNFVNQNGALINKSGATNQNQTIPTSFTNETGATFNVEASRTVTFSGSFVNSGDVVVEGAISFSSAAITVNTGNTISGTGVVNIFGSNTANGTADLVLGTATVTQTSNGNSITGSSGQDLIIPSGTTHNVGLGTWAGFDGLTNNGTLAIVNTLGLEMDLTNNSQLSWNGGALTDNGSGGATIFNTATFDMNAHNQAVTDVSFVNQSGGTINKLGATSQNQTIPTSFTNETGASFNVAVSRTVTFSGSFVNSGAVDVEGAMSFSNAAITVNTGNTIGGTGAINIFGNNTANGTADLVLATATVTQTSNGNSITGSNGQDLIIPSGTTHNVGLGTWAGFDGLTNNGTLAIVNTLGLEMDLTNNSQLSWNGGALTDNGSGGATIFNTATFDMNAHNQAVTDVSFVNQNGATINKLGATNQNQTIPTSFTNETGASFNVAASRTVTFSGSFVNSGAVDVEGAMSFSSAAITVNTGNTIGGTGVINIVGNNTVNGTADLVLATATVAQTSNGNSITGSNGQDLIIPSGTTHNVGLGTWAGFDGLTNNGTLAIVNTLGLEMDLTNNSQLSWNGGALTDNGSGGATIFNAATFDINAHNQAVTAVSFVNQNGGVINKLGALNQNQTIPTSFTNETGGIVNVDVSKNLTLSGPSLNNGQVNNSGGFIIAGQMNGTGSFSGNIVSNAAGTLAPGLSPGCMSFANDYSMNNGSLEIEVSGTTPCSGHDQISVTGTANLSGTLIANIGSYLPPSNSVITFIDAGTVNGTFSSISPALPADWALQYDFPNAGEVSLVYSGPGPVGGLDFVVGVETSGPNNTVIVPVTVNNFTNIATYQGSITFDENVLNFVSASNPQTVGTSNFGEPGQGSIPSNTITFSWYDINQATLADGSIVMELEFTVASNATTGFTDIEINGSATPLGFSTDPAATTLSNPGVTQGGATIDADAPTVDVINIVSNNANDITLATIGDVISLSFTTSETPDQTPVVSIVEGGPGAVTVSGSGTSYTATKTVAAGGDGLVTFSIQIQDQFGNSSTATATTDGSQVIIDTEDPTITCPADVNEDTDAGVCGRVVTFTDPTGADNLPGHSVAQTGGPASGSTFPVGTTTITYTVTDAAGNTASCDFDITITDNEAPNVITQPVTVQLDANGSASISVNDIDNGSSDACGIDTRVLDISSFSCDDLGNNTVTLTVTDVNGNVASATAVVTVEDVIPPSITCPAPQTISTDAGLCTAALPDLTGLALVDDNCAGGSSGSGGGSIVAGSSTKIGNGYLHSLVVADDGTLWSMGNNEYGQLGNGVFSNTNQSTPIQVGTDTDWASATGGEDYSLALKNDGTIWAWGRNHIGQLGIGSSVDQASPVQVGTDNDWIFVESGKYHCIALKSNGSLWGWGTGLGLGIGTSSPQNSPLQIGTDSDWIEFSAGSSYSLGLKSNGTLWAWGTNSFGELGIGSNSQQLSPVQVGTDTDWAFISASNIQSFALKSDGSLWSWGHNHRGQLGIGSTVQQTSPVQIGTDTDWAVVSGGWWHGMAIKNNGTLWGWGQSVNGQLGISPGADQLVPIQVGSDTDWAAISRGGPEYHYKGVKSNGNLYGWGLNAWGMIGNGTTGGSVTPPTLLSLTVDPGSGSGSSLTVTQSPAIGTALAVGAHTVSITVADASGNTASCDVIVTVEDNEDPTVVTQNITVQLDASGNASITAAQVDGGSTDPCGIASVTVSPENFSCGDVGVNQVTLTVTDVNGNVATGTADVTVEDNILPTVVTQNVTVQLDASGNASVSAAQVDNGSSDNCSISTITVSPNTFTCAEVGANTVTLTVTDVNGNVETGTATVTVEDNVLPTVVTQNVTVQLDAAGNASVTAAQVDNGSSDNCSIASITVSPSTFTCAEVGANTVTLTVTDVNGNVETGTATVTVEDNVLPTVVTQNVTVQLDAAGNASITAAQIDNGSSDNCGIASITVSPSTFTCSEEGVNTVTLTVTDVNGNVETGTATVTVEDNILPTVVTQDISVQLDASGNATITAAQIDNGSSDNCAIASITVSPNSFTCAEVGANTVTLTVTDVNGNVETGTATVTVLDDPIIDVSGKSVSELGDDIPGVIYDLAGDDGPQTTTGLSYTFQVAPCGSTNDIGGDKIDDAATNNGVDVLDAFDIVKHLLLIDQLGTPYKRIAADVNGTGSINILDAFQVLRKINNIIPFFTNPTTGAQDAIWTFIPDDYVFADPLNPWNFETRRDILSPNANLIDQDFIGVKLGDVNNTWNPNQLRTAAPSDSMFFNLDGMTAQQGDLIRIPVKVNKFMAITGYQFSLNWDPSVLEFQEVHHETLEGVYGLEDARKGVLTTAWVDLSGESLSLEDGTVAFELVFKAVGGKDSKTEFKITSDVTPSKAYDITRELLGIGFASEEININRGNGELAGYSFDQNVPNPFGEATNLLFSLSQTEKVQIVIYNLNGQLIKRFDGTYAAGDHQIKWDGRNEKGMEVSEGIYMAQMVAGDFSAAIRISKNR